jgi:hypothetical protein
MRPDEPLEPEQDAFLSRVAAHLREPVPLTDRVERAVLERLRSEPAPPKPWRPLLPFALAASLAAMFGLGMLVGRRETTVPEPADAPHSVDFALRTAAASDVALVGDFNDWDPQATPLHHAWGDVWTVSVPLRPGRYRYTFIVDGTRWHRDPAAPRALDDFGAPTSVITIAQR